MGKGDVGEWRRVIGDANTLCRLCGLEEETGSHLVFGCVGSYGLRPWDWASWEELDDKRRWRYPVEREGGKEVVRDRVEDFFVALDRALVGVGYNVGLWRGAVGVCVAMCTGAGVWFLFILLCLYVVSTTGWCTYRPPCHAGWRMRG